MSSRAGLRGLGGRRKWASRVLLDLNRGDDTPGSTGGACLPLVNGGSHFAEPGNRAIYHAVRDGLRSTCPPGRLTTLHDLPD